MDALALACQRLAPRLYCVQTLRSQWTCTTTRLIGFRSARDTVPSLGPTRLKRKHLSLRARIASLRFIAGKIRHATLLFRWLLVPFLGGKAGGTLAKMRSRDIGIQLFVRTRLAIGFAMVMAVGAESFPLKIMRRHPDGLQGGFGPLHHGGDMPIILPVAQGLGRPADLVFRLDQRLAIIALDNARAGRHVGRFVIREMTL